MSPIERESEDHEAKATWLPDRSSSGVFQLRLASWALGTVVVLCLLLVVWFWTLILLPPHSEGVPNNTRTWRSSHARSNAETEPEDSHWGDDLPSSAADSWQPSHDRGVLPTSIEGPSR